MQTHIRTISRPAKVRFKNSNEVECTLIYYANGEGPSEDPYANFVIRLNDSYKTEKVLDCCTIDMIIFLQ